MQQLINLAKHFDLSGDRSEVLLQIPTLRLGKKLMGDATDKKIDEFKRSATTGIVHVLITSLRENEPALAKVFEPIIFDLVYEALVIDEKDFVSWSTKFVLPTPELIAKGYMKPQRISDCLNAVWQGYAFVTYSSLPEKYAEETETEFFFSLQTKETT